MPRNRMFDIYRNAETTLCPYGGSVSEEHKDKQIALAQADAIADAIYSGLVDAARIIVDGLRKGAPKT